MDPTSSSITVPLQSRRRERASLFQRLQHAIPATALLIAGVQGLQGGARGAALGLVVAEIVFGGLLLRAMVREVRAAMAGRTHGAAPHAGVDWTEVLAGCVLLVEAGERWHLHHHLPRPTLVTAAVTIALGIFHGRVAARAAGRRVLIVEPRGITVRRRWRRFVAPWEALAAIEVDAHEAVLRRRDGRAHRLDLDDLRNAPAVCAALAEARARWRATLPPDGPATDAAAPLTP